MKKIIVLITFTLYLQQICTFHLSWWTILPATICVICTNYSRGLFVFSGLYSIFLIAKFNDLLNSLRLVMNEAIVTLANWGWSLPLQNVVGIDASLAIGLLLVFLTTINTKHLTLGILITVLLLPLFLQEAYPPIVFAFVCISCMLPSTYEQLKKIPIGHISIIVIVCIVFPPIKNIPIVSQVGDVIAQQKDTLQYGAQAETQLTNGDLQHVHSFNRSNTEAFTIAMEHPKAMYLKSFIGSEYENGWTAIDGQLLQDTPIRQYLKDAHYFEQTQFAQAANTDSQIVSITATGISKAFALTPYELAKVPNDFRLVKNSWQSTNVFGTKNYTFSISNNSYADYPAIASDLYATTDAEFLKLEALHNTLSYRHYVDIPQETKTLLKNHFEITEHKSYEQTIEQVQRHLEQLTYNEQVEQPTTDFLPFLLEETKEGYSVHYATLATLLFRAYGVPARYVEGYIITNDEIRDQKEIVITNNSRHAWPEIYIDWIGWVPIEVTPGYADKMPSIANTTFEQKQATGSSQITANPSTSQVAIPPALEEPTVPEMDETPKTPWAWLLLIIVILLIIGTLKWRKQNTLQQRFITFIYKCNKKWASHLPVHEVIYRINTPEALDVYRMYNEIHYGHLLLTKDQKKLYKQQLKLLKKQI